MRSMWRMDMIVNDFNSRIAEGLAAMDRAILRAEHVAAPDV